MRILCLPYCVRLCCWECLTTGVRPVLRCVILSMNYVEGFLLSLLGCSVDYQRDDVVSMKLKYILNFVDFTGFYMTQNVSWSTMWRGFAFHPWEVLSPRQRLYIWIWPYHKLCKYLNIHNRQGTDKHYRHRSRPKMVNTFMQCTQNTCNDYQKGLDTRTDRVTDHRSYMTLTARFTPNRFPDSCSKELYQFWCVLDRASSW